jgi:type IV pilus assembly protein PilM
VILKQVSLPLLDDSEVGSALRFEARKHLPFDPLTMIVDYQILGRFPSERKLEILLAAVSRDHLETHLAALRLLDLEPDIVDATPLALANALGAMEDGIGAHVIVDIGDKASHLVLVQRGQPFFSRRLDFGGDDLTKAIADSAQIPFEEAEEWKLAAGSDNPGFRVDWQSPELASVPDVLRAKLVDEILRSLAFYRTQASLGDIARMWVAGASARLPGLAARLTEQIGIPVAVFDPLAGDRGLTGTPQFAQAYGLALRAT